MEIGCRSGTSFGLRIAESVSDAISNSLRTAAVGEQLLERNF